MRILVITGSLNQGGAEYQSLAIADLLQRKGHKVKVLALTDYSFFYPYVQSKKLDYEHFSNTDSRIKRIFKTITFVNKYNPEFVISYTRVVSKTALIAKLFSYRRFKLLVSERTALVLPRRDKFYFFILRYADIITTNSVSKFDHIQTKYKYLRSKTFFFTNIIDYKKFQSSKVFRINVIKRFCYIGRLSKEKNVHNLISAFAKVAKEKDNWELNIYGEARNESYKKEILQQIDKAQLKNKIKFCGATNNVPKVLSEHNVLCLFSFYEGFSNVLSEGLSAGLVLVASDIPENKYILEDGKNGFLADPENIEKIQSVLVKVLDLKNDQLNNISITNKNKAASIFDENKIYIDYKKLF